MTAFTIDNPYIAKNFTLCWKGYDLWDGRLIEELTAALSIASHIFDTPS